MRASFERKVLLFSNSSAIHQNPFTLVYGVVPQREKNMKAEFSSCWLNGHLICNYPIKDLTLVFVCVTLDEVVKIMPKTVGYSAKGLQAEQ